MKDWDKLMTDKQIMRMSQITNLLDSEADCDGTKFKLRSEDIRAALIRTASKLSPLQFMDLLDHLNTEKQTQAEAKRARHLDGIKKRKGPRKPLSWHTS